MFGIVVPYVFSRILRLKEAEQTARSGGYVEGLSPKPRESPRGQGIIARAEHLQFKEKDDGR
jgi:hypothetical protein